MDATVLPAPPTFEAFVKGLTEPVEGRPAEDLFDGPKCGCREDAQMVNRRSRRNHKACQGFWGMSLGHGRFKNVHVDGL